MSKTFCAAFLLPAMLSSCSVGMAVSGDQNPDLSVVRSGVAQSEIELHLGRPVKVNDLGNGMRTAVYEYEVGNEPSAGRAVGHAAMDVLTLGIWEIVGTPIEAVQGETHQVSVTYDSTDTAVAVTGH